MTMKISRLLIPTSLLLGSIGLAVAHDPEPAPEQFEPHGGTLRSTDTHHFEVAFERGAVRLFVSDREFRPVDPQRSVGTVSVRLRGEERTVTGALTYVAPRGTEPGHLRAPLDLARVQEGQGTATFELEGVPLGTASTAAVSSSKASFQEAFKLARQYEWSCPKACVPPTNAAGKCGGCQGELVQRFYIFSCVEHHGVTSRGPGSCWIDQRALTKQISTGGLANRPKPAPAHGHGHGDDQGHGHGHGHDHDHGD